MNSDSRFRVGRQSRKCTVGKHTGKKDGAGKAGTSIPQTTEPWMWAGIVADRSPGGRSSMGPTTYCYW